MDIRRIHPSTVSLLQHESHTADDLRWIQSTTGVYESQARSHIGMGDCHSHQTTVSLNRSSWELFQLHPLQVNVSFVLDGPSTQSDDYIRSILKVAVSTTSL